MSESTPQDIAERAARRDDRAFARLYDEHLDTVYRYVFYKVGEPNLAEELTAVVFAKAWEGIERFQWRNLPFQHWLLRIASNVVVDHWRSRRRATTSIDGLADAASDEPLPEDRVAYDVEMQTLQAALLRLPDDQRDVLILRFIEGYSHAETASVLHKSEVAVRQIQVRALRAVRKQLTDEGDHPVVARHPGKLGTTARREPGPREEPEPAG
jgi:RNA polymerase sigma-70 factor (ECF subfamily)